LSVEAKPSSRGHAADIPVRHILGMDPIPTDLSSAAVVARERLSTLARGAAASGTPGRPAAATLMAAAAREAIFTDALDGAIRARLEALKSVTK
jgi:hypothetical protein